MSTGTKISRPHETSETLLTGPARRDGSSFRFRRYFVTLFVFPAFFYLAAIPMVRMPSYERWGPSHYGPALDFAWHTQGENADVVVFGDSAAFLGVDPRLVDRQLGIKSVVLPNTVGSLPVLGDAALRFYLGHNQKPRLIVLYFTPWDLDYTHEANTHLFEGEEMLIRHETPAGVFAFARAHPLEIAAFPLRSYSSFGPQVLKSLLKGVDRGAETAKARGHVDDTEPWDALSGACAIPSSYVDHRKTASVRELAERYRAAGFRVAVYLAPIPGCRNADALRNETGGGLAGEPAAVLPPEDFKADGLYAHMEPGAVPAASMLFARLIAGQLPAR